MPLTKKNSYGTVTVSDRVIVRGILSAIERSGLSGDVWLATRRGKLLAEERSLTNVEMRNACTADFDDEGLIRLSFCVIVRFGVPIGKTVEDLCTVIAELIRSRTGKLPGSIKVTVTGIRSSRIARRNMELEMLYGSEQQGS